MTKKLIVSFLLLGVATFSFQPANSQTLSGIVAFGDSLSDLANTYNELGSDGSYALAGYNSCYYDVGRWSNGPVWVENLARLLRLPALQINDGTSLFGTDFAWGGSTSGSGYSYELLSNLQTQVSSYIQLLSTKGAHMPNVSQTLFTVWSGGNDVIYKVQSGSTVTPQQVSQNIGAAITALYESGAHYFLVPNLPPLGDKPNYVDNPAYRAEANQFVNQYNPLLQSQLAQLQRSLHGIMIIPFDVFHLFKRVLANPSAYNLTNVTNAAFTSDILSPHGGYVVNNPDQYLFWDGTHPTRVGHELIGEAAYSAVLAAFRSLFGGTPDPSAPIALVLPFSALARDDNEFRTATALENVRYTATGDLSDVIDTLVFAPASELQRAFAEINPSMVSSFSTLAFAIQTSQSAQLQERLIAIRDGRQYGDEKTECQVNQKKDHASRQDRRVHHENLRNIEQEQKLEKGCDFLKTRLIEMIATLSIQRLD